MEQVVHSLKRYISQLSQTNNVLNFCLTFGLTFLLNFLIIILPITWLVDVLPSNLNWLVDSAFALSISCAFVATIFGLINGKSNYFLYEIGVKISLLIVGFLILVFVFSSILSSTSEIDKLRRSLKTMELTEIQIQQIEDMINERGYVTEDGIRNIELSPNQIDQLIKELKNQGFIDEENVINLLNKQSTIIAHEYINSTAANKSHVTETVETYITTPTATPTTVPTPTIPLPLCNEDVIITSPRNTERVKGFVKIIGTAQHEKFEYYKVEYGYGIKPDEEHFIMVDEYNGVDGIIDRQINHGILGIWNTNSENILPGNYTLKLSVVKNDGNFTQCKINVIVEK